MKVSRRGFLALASGLLVPTPESVRRYFFAPAAGWLPAGDVAFLEGQLSLVAARQALIAAGYIGKGDPVWLDKDGRIYVSRMTSVAIVIIDGALTM